jgi:hypothetical protein
MMQSDYVPNLDYMATAGHVKFTGFSGGYNTAKKFSKLCILQSSKK